MEKRFFLLPLKAIKEEPYLFFLWVLSAAGLGLIGFWFPFLVLPSAQLKTIDVLQRLICSGVLPSFGVVFVSSAMAEAIAGTRSDYDGHTETVLCEVRAIAVIVCLAVILAQSGLLSRSLSDGGGYRWDWFLQLVLVVASLLLGAYLYCFRYIFKESVSARVSQQDAEGKVTVEKAKAAQSDNSGNKL